MAPSPSVRVFCFWAFALLLGFASGLAEDHTTEPATAGRVLDLTDDNFETEIAKHDHILVDFYAPWCGYCKRLSPQLDIAAPVLARGSRPIFLAKIDVEKHSKVGSKYKISAFPTLKYFIKGIPTDYTGPRKADGIITHLRRLSAPSIEHLNSEAELHEFVKSIGTEIPLFLGFGLKAADLEEIANNYRSKAWFAVMETFSEEVMEDFNFDKDPALVVTRGQHGEKTTFYGPFEAEDVNEFVLQNLLPLVSHITPDTLKRVREDGRPVVVAVLESDSTPEDKEFIKKLKMAAPAYRKFVVAYVVAPQWPEFLRPFWIRKETKFPTVFVWADDTFVVSNKTDAFIGSSVETELYHLLQGYQDNALKRHKMRTPSLWERATANLPLTMGYGLLCLGILVLLLKGWDTRAFEEGREEHGDDAGGSSDGVRGPRGDKKED